MKLYEWMGDDKYVTRLDLYKYFKSYMLKKINADQTVYNAIISNVSQY